MRITNFSQAAKPNMQRNNTRSRLHAAGSTVFCCLVYGTLISVLSHWKLWLFHPMDGIPTKIVIRSISYHAHV